MSYQNELTKYNVFLLKILSEKHQINTSVDYQRGYIWTEKQQQLMFKTLMTDFPITGLHVNKVIDQNGEDIYRVLDGKQRITTILKIINNEIPWKIPYAEGFENLFGTKKRVYFSDLPPYNQTRILNKSLAISEYNNLSEVEEMTLFKILNNGTQLKGIQFILAGVPILRREYLTPILIHPTFFYSSTERALENSKIEKQVACIYAALFPFYKYGELNFDTISFLDKNLDNSEAFIPIEKVSNIKYLNSWRKVMNQIKNDIFYYLNILNINDIPLTTTNLGSAVFPFIYAVTDNLNEEEFIKLVLKTNSLTSKIVLDSKSCNFGNSDIKKWMNYIEEKILPYI